MNNKNTNHKQKDKSFRLAAKHLFLTYPKCNLEPKDALEQFNTKLNIKEYIISQESHQDGDKHLHARERRR